MRQFYDLSKVQNFYLDGPTVDRWQRLLGTWGIVLLYPFAVAGSFVYRMFQSLFYSLIGLVLAQRVHCSLTYAGILSVTIVAITPAVLLKTVVWISGISIPFSWMLYFVVALAYVAFGLAPNRDTSSPDSAVVSGAVPG